jgi:hypothetical protein
MLLSKCDLEIIRTQSRKARKGKKFKLKIKASLREAFMMSAIL